MAKYVLAVVIALCIDYTVYSLLSQYEHTPFVLGIIIGTIVGIVVGIAAVHK